MKIDTYKILIANLPVRQQCFTTKRTTWNKAEIEIDWFKKLNDNLFGNNETLTISRQDVFETQDIREKIIKTVYWGYPYGMRGNHFINILERINKIESALLKLKQTNQPTTSDFNELTATFKDVRGLGLSTYSKLLYFFNLKFNNNPCIILDQRLIDVFSNNKYSDFQQLNNTNYDNAEKKYLDFIQITKQLAIKIGTKSENIELFLFAFGNNLKLDYPNKI